MKHDYAGGNNCKCGRHFRTFKGLNMHLSAMKRRERLKRTCDPANPNQGSHP